MFWLAEADQRRLMSFNHESQEAAFLEPLVATRFLLSAITALLPSECAVYRLQANVLPLGRVTATDPKVDASQQAGRDRWAELLGRGNHAVVPHWERLGGPRALGAWAEISMGQIVTVACYRTGADFTERDRAILDAISFTAVQLSVRSEMRGLVATSVTTLGLSGREAEIVAWVTRGKTNTEIAQLLFLAPGTVKKHLDNVYRKLGVGTRTEAAGLALDACWGTNARASLANLSDSTRAAIGVTRREADVLGLAGSGKTNVEIGVELGMSTGTAKQHLENIYRKLHVNSRTDATKVALTAISGHAMTDS